MKPVARLVFREYGVNQVHIKTYDDVALMKVDLDLIYSGDGWIQLRVGDNGEPSFEEYVRASSIVFYRSEVFNV